MHENSSIFQVTDGWPDSDRLRACSRGSGFEVCWGGGGGAGGLERKRSEQALVASS